VKNDGNSTGVEGTKHPNHDKTPVVESLLVSISSKHGAKQSESASNNGRQLKYWEFTNLATPHVVLLCGNLAPSDNQIVLVAAVVVVIRNID
jgi:hypothetical protein